MSYLFEKYGNIEVAWLSSLDGGGRDTSKEFVIIVEKLIGKVDRICEFCAGPSFIGFNLLSKGLCNSLCLIDVNPEAVKAMKETIIRNNLQDKVTVYLSDVLDNIPENEKWDLVVSNPPHFCAYSEEEYKQNIILKDHNWLLHDKFFSNVNKFLKPHGSILVQECYMGCEENTFLPFLEKGNLQFIDSFMFRKPNNQWRDVYYYIWAKKKYKEFIWKANPIELIEFHLSKIYLLDCALKKLKSWNKYRFEFFNDLGEEKSIVLLNGKDKSGKDIKVFSIENILQNTKNRSNIFYLTPGNYELIDSKNRKCLMKIEVV